MRTLLRGVGLMTLAACSTPWNSTPTPNPSPPPSSPFTELVRQPLNPNLAIPSLPGALQAIYDSTQPDPNSDLPDVSWLLQPRQPTPAWTAKVMGEDHGAPVRRWRAVEVDLGQVATVAALHHPGVHLTIFPDVAFDLLPRRALAAPASFSWFGTADGKLEQSIAGTWSDGKQFATGTIGIRGYRVLNLAPSIFAIIELVHPPEGACALGVAQ